MVRIKITYKDEYVIEAIVEIITVGDPVYYMKIDLKSRCISECDAPDNHYNFFCTKILYHILNLLDEGKETPENFMMGFY